MLEVLQPLAPELSWILCVAFVIAFLLAFSVGANDVSNSFGTSVGSRVLTVTQACILATFFEVAGATLLGYSVCDTFRTSMYDVDLYKDSQKELMLGALACIIGSATWNVIATALKMPISGTHSIVGATIGFSIVLRGFDSIKWMKMLRIVASWFISPILSGVISSLIYVLISKTIIRKIDPLKHGLHALPLFYGATVFINVASLVIDGPKVFGLNTLSWYAGLFIALVISGAAICGVAMILVPKIQRQILDELLSKNRRGKLSTNMTSIFGADSKSGFDNSAFSPAPTSSSDPELTLNAGQLMEDSGKCKPPIAPKPEHLQRATSVESGQAQLEEIDLSDQQQQKTGKLALAEQDIEAIGGHSKSSNRPQMIRGERFEVFRLFSSLQILTACFASFAHGTNDVSNAVAPLIPIWNIYATGFEDVTQQTPVWILAFGGIGICTGLWAWGRAVMSTVGDGLTQLTPSKGFSIELGAAISVLSATKFGLPISTTHCKVGSVVIVGLVGSWFCSQDNLLDMSKDEREKSSREAAVDWRLFGNIAITWVVTLPMAAAASAAVMMGLKWMLL